MAPSVMMKQPAAGEAGYGTVSYFTRHTGPGGYHTQVSFQDDVCVPPSTIYT
jgi:hypothetical protein